MVRKAALDFGYAKSKKQAPSYAPTGIRIMEKLPEISDDLETKKLDLHPVIT